MHNTTIYFIFPRAPVVALGRIMMSLFIRSNSTMLGMNKQLTEIF